MMIANLIFEKFGTDVKPGFRQEMPCRSFLLNFIELLYIQHAQTSRTVTDIDGVDRAIDSDVSGATVEHRGYKPTLSIAAQPGNANAVYHTGYEASVRNYADRIHLLGQRVGIVVGTGSNPVTLLDHSLQTRIPHGIGAGQLEIGGCDVTLSPSFSHPNGQMTIRRYFTNRSAASITINEVGLHAAGSIVLSPWTAYSFLIARDLVAPGVAVDVGEILRVSYVVRTTV